MGGGVEWSACSVGTCPLQIDFCTSAPHITFHNSVLILEHCAVSMCVIVSFSIVYCVCV